MNNDTVYFEGVVYSKQDFENITTALKAGRVQLAKGIMRRVVRSGIEAGQISPPTEAVSSPRRRHHKKIK